MGVNIKECQRVVGNLEKKRDSGGLLNKGEEIILTLAAEYDKICGQNKATPDDMCVDMIKVYKKRITEEDEFSIEINTIELNMLLEALLERLYTN